MNDLAETLIRTIEKPFCYLCGTQGEPFYNNQTDRLFGAPGLWNFKKCPHKECGLIWLDPMPVPEDIGRCYVNYYTHMQTAKNYPLQIIINILKKIEHYFENGYLAHSFSYPMTKSKLQKNAGLLISALPGVAERFARSVAWLHFYPGGRLLDVGCGNGGFLSRMERLGWKVEGVEIDMEAVAYARSRGLSVRYGTLKE